MFFKNLCGVFFPQCCCVSRLDELQIDTQNPIWPESPSNSEAFQYLSLNEGPSLNKIQLLQLIIIDSEHLLIGTEYTICPTGLKNSPQPSTEGLVCGGSSPTCEIPLSRNENGTGNTHFLIRYHSASRSYELKDLGEGNGTFIRIDHPIKLESQQILSFGDSHMEVVIDNFFTPNLNLKFIDGPKTGRELEEIFSVFKAEDAPVRIGRKPDCHIRFDDANLSRYEAVLMYGEEGWVYVDGDCLKASTNGSWLFSEDFTKIEDGMIFKAAQTLFKCILSFEEVREDCLV